MTDHRYSDIEIAAVRRAIDDVLFEECWKVSRGGMKCPAWGTAPAY